MNPAANQKTTGDRLEFVDVLRGFALIGVFGANLLIFAGYTYMSEGEKAALSTAASDTIINTLQLIFIENKFMGLFSFLFGVSFWLFLERANARGARGTQLFYRRIAWLFVIGLIHGWLFWCFDVLRFYALWALFLPLFLKLSNKVLLGSALFFAVLAPALISGFNGWLTVAPAPDSTLDELALRTFATGSFSSFLYVNWLYDWYLTLSWGQLAYQIAIFGRLLFGLFAARALLLTDLPDHRKLFLALLVGGGAIGIAGNIVTIGNFIVAPPEGGDFVLPFARRFVSQFGYLLLTLAYVAGLALLFQRPWWTKVLSPLGNVGRMALTCYLLQTLFGLWLFYGFMPGPGLMGKIGPLRLVPIWLVGFALQVLFASIWLKHFRFGPAEWLWRSLTYWKVQPFKTTMSA